MEYYYCKLCDEKLTPQSINVFGDTYCPRCWQLHYKCLSLYIRDPSVEEMKHAIQSLIRITNFNNWDFLHERKLCNADPQCKYCGQCDMCGETGYLVGLICIECAKEEHHDMEEQIKSVRVTNSKFA